MNLNIEEKRVIYRLLICVMNADSITKIEELTFLDEIFDKFELSIDEFDHMEDMDFDYLIKEFANFADEKKNYAVQLFKEMASCDGYIDPRELMMIETFK